MCFRIYTLYHTPSNDLTVDNVSLGYKECRSDKESKTYDIPISLSKTESIANGKRYTFNINTENNKKWVNHCNEENFIEIKEGSIFDNSSNKNDRSQFQFEISIYGSGTCAIDICNVCNVE